MNKLTAAIATITIAILCAEPSSAFWGKSNSSKYNSVMEARAAVVDFLSSKKEIKILDYDAT